jgi:hypothetical protein
VTVTDDYDSFIRAKVTFDKAYGFPVNDTEVSPSLLPHQRDVVRWAVAGGRRAIFASFGLGKSVMQLEILRLIRAHEGGRVLIVCPLGVRQEFVRDAHQLLGLDITFVRRSNEVSDDGIYVTNYESIRDGKLDPDLFVAVSLDEAAILRSYGSLTFQTFLTLFDNVKYRFVATATPSPNRYKELIHYAGFLGVMSTGDALTRFFKRDSTKANNLTIHPHKEAEFHLWLSSWAVFLESPAQLGYDATGYDLPDLHVTWHELPVDHLARVTTERDGQSRMFRSAALGVTDSAAEKRATLAERVDLAMSIVDGYRAAGPADPTEDQVIVWCDLNDEQHAVEKALATRGLSYSSVHGSLSVDEIEQRMEDWRERRTYALIGKPVQLGQGVNLQQCNKAIFVGVTYKFNDFIQACHRVQRYGQTRTCEIHLVYAESEREIVKTLQTKWDQHKELNTTMSDVLATHGLDPASITEALTRSIGVKRIELSGEGWVSAHNDCVLETKQMEDNSVGLVVTSIPFSNHYSYSVAIEDFGHTDDNDHFWAQMDHLTPQLLRILEPGRIYCCHVKDRILFGNVTGTGAPTVSPFHAEALLHGIRHGFDYMGMITVTTDVVRENNQSYRLGWTEQCKDGTKMGVGSPEYVLIFRKPQTDRSRGYADTPVVKDKTVYSRARWQTDAHAFWRSSGNRDITAEDLKGLSAGARQKLFTDWTRENIYDAELHVKIGEDLDGKGMLSATHMSLEPASWSTDVWDGTDVLRMRTLNTEQSQKDLENHVCPLPLDIVDRLIGRYSNPGDLVFDPFGGLATVAVRALKAGRRGRVVELNPGYFRDGVRYLQAMEQEVGIPTLFDLLAVEAEEATEGVTVGP